MQEEIIISSSKRNELIDINSKVEEIVAKSNVKEGLCSVFACHATAAIVINENYDPNICEDFLECLSRIVPAGKWKHDRVDGNGDSHIKAAICGPGEVIPVKNGKLLLGRWQSLMFAEFDGPRNGRKIIVSVTGKLV